MDPELTKLVLGFSALAAIFCLELKALGMGINGGQLRLVVVLLAAGGGMLSADTVKALLVGLSGGRT